MRQRCDADYWAGMEKLAPDEAPCGRSFDDVDRSTICPHERLGGGLSAAEIAAILQDAP